MLSVQQSKSGTQFGGGSSTTELLTFTSPVSAGSLIVAIVIFPNDLVTLLNVTDNINSGSYSVAGFKRVSGLGNIYFTYFPVSASGTMTVTSAFSSSIDTAEMFLYEVFNASSSPLDITNSQTSTSVTINSGSITTTNSNDILFGAALVSNNVVNGGWNYTINPVTTNAAQYIIKTSTGTYNSVFTQSASGLWSSVIVSFKQTAIVSISFYGSSSARCSCSGSLAVACSLAGVSAPRSFGFGTLLIPGEPIFVSGECDAVSVNSGSILSGQILQGECDCSSVCSGYLESRVEYAILSADGSMVLYATFWDYRELHVFYQNSRGSQVYPVTMTAQPAFDPMTQYVLQRGWQINVADVTPIWVIFSQTPEQLVVTNAQAFYNAIMALNVVDLFKADDAAWITQSRSTLTVSGTVRLAGICVARASSVQPPDKDLALRRLIESVNAILQCKFQQQH